MKRNEIEAAFAKLSKSERAMILGLWDAETFADINEAALPNVVDDIRECNPTAFGKVTASASTTGKTPTTAQALDALADEIYNPDADKPEADEGEVELNTHQPPKPTGLFTGTDKVLDAGAIFDKYNSVGKKGDVTGPMKTGDGGRKSGGK